MNQVPIHDNKIILRIKDGQVKINSETPVSFEDLLSAFCTIMLGTMRQIIEGVPDATKKDAKGALYDAFNVMASRVLEQFAPEYEMRPNLTAAAILEAENNIIKAGGLKNVEPHS